MDAAEIKKRLLPEIRDALSHVAVGYPIHELGDELERLSQYFGALGVACLLETVDQERFRENLVRSGHARRYFLRKSREEGNDEDPRLALGRTEAFLDVLAAGDLSLAKEIADLSAKTWRSDWEYEDDFCYRLFLQRVIWADDTQQADLDKLIARFHQALEGGASVRFEISKALLGRDRNAFRQALTSLIEELDEELEEARERNLEPDPATCCCWAHSSISTEGLALLRIAELKAMMPLEGDEELRLCPTVAKIPIADREYQDMFLRIEFELTRGR